MRDQFCPQTKLGSMSFSSLFCCLVSCWLARETSSIGLPHSPRLRKGIIMFLNRGRSSKKLQQKHNLPTTSEQAKLETTSLQSLLANLAPTSAMLEWWQRARRETPLFLLPWELLLLAVAILPTDCFFYYIQFIIKNPTCSGKEQDKERWGKYNIPSSRRFLLATVLPEQSSFLRPKEGKNKREENKEPMRIEKKKRKRNIKLLQIT